MTQQQLEAIIEWLRKNNDRPISFIEKELLKSAVDGAYTVGDLVRNLSNLTNLR